jgi:hypothetical protein
MDAVAMVSGPCLLQIRLVSRHDRSRVSMGLQSSQLDEDRLASGRAEKYPKKTAGFTGCLETQLNGGSLTGHSFSRAKKAEENGGLQPLKEPIDRARLHSENPLPIASDPGIHASIRPERPAAFQNCIPITDW